MELKEHVILHHLDYPLRILYWTIDEAAVLVLPIFGGLAFEHVTLGLDGFRILLLGTAKQQEALWPQHTAPRAVLVSAQKPETRPHPSLLHSTGCLMKMRLLYGRLENLTHQRQALLTLVAFLLAITLTKSLVLLLRGERLVIVPPEITRRFWVSNAKVSAAYLEEMALFFTSLLLDMTPASAAYKRDLILRHTTPEAYGALKTKLLEDEKRLKKEHVTTSFHPVALKVNAAKGTVELTGDLVRFVGAKRISQSRDTYRLQLTYQAPHLLIQSFQLIRSDSPA